MTFSWDWKRFLSPILEMLHSCLFPTPLSIFYFTLRLSDSSRLSLPFLFKFYKPSQHLKGCLWMCSSDKEILSFPSDLPCVSNFEIPEDSSACFSKHFVWVGDRSSSGSLGKLWLTSIRNTSGIHWQVFPALCFTPASVQKPEWLPSRSSQFEKT